MRKKLLYFLFALLIILFILAYSLYRLMNARTFQLYGNLTHHIDTNEKVVFLTFDDGPNKNTQRILDLLDELDIQANFFLIGKQMEEYPNETKMIIEQGHLVGNHSYTHERLVLKNSSIIQNEVDRTNKIIKDFGYTKEILFRPPYGKKIYSLPKYLNSIHQKTIMWDVEPESFKDVNISSESVANYTINNVKPGSIILLHPMNYSDDFMLNSIELIVSDLKQKGYEFKLLSEYISN